MSPEKTLLYQLVVCVPIVALGALVFGERIAAMPSAVALGSLAYQTIVVGTTFSLWFALIVKFSASRLSAFTFLTPLFGVAAGHLVLGEPLTPAFALAVVLVAAGLILVNRPQMTAQDDGGAPNAIIFADGDARCRTSREGRPRWRMRWRRAKTALDQGHAAEAEQLARKRDRARTRATPPRCKLLGGALLLQERHAEAIAPLEGAARVLRDPASTRSLRSRCARPAAPTTRCRGSSAPSSASRPMCSPSTSSAFCSIR